MSNDADETLDWDSDKPSCSGVLLLCGWPATTPLSQLPIIRSYIGSRSHCFKIGLVQAMPPKYHHTTVTVYSTGKQIPSIDASLATQMKLADLGYGPFPALAGMVRVLSSHNLAKHDKANIPRPKPYKAMDFNKAVIAKMASKRPTQQELRNATRAITEKQAEGNADPVENKCYQ